MAQVGNNGSFNGADGSGRRDGRRAFRPGFRELKIPVALLQCPWLSCEQTVMLAEIAALQTPDRGCYAGNDHFARLLKISSRQVRRVIGALEETGVIVEKRVKGGRERQLYLAGPDLEAAISVAVMRTDGPPTMRTRCPHKPDMGTGGPHNGSMNGDSETGGPHNGNGSATMRTECPPIPTMRTDRPHNPDMRTICPSYADNLSARSGPPVRISGTNSPHHMEKVHRRESSSSPYPFFLAGDGEVIKSATACGADDACGVDDEEDGYGTREGTDGMVGEGEREATQEPAGRGVANAAGAGEGAAPLGGACEPQREGRVSRSGLDPGDEAVVERPVAAGDPGPVATALDSREDGCAPARRQEQIEFLMAHPLVGDAISRATAVKLVSQYPFPWIRGWLRSGDVRRANNPLGMLRSKLQQEGEPPRNLLEEKAYRKAPEPKPGIDGVSVQGEVRGRKKTEDGPGDRMYAETMEWIRDYRQAPVDMTPLSSVMGQLPEWMQEMAKARGLGR